MKAKKIYFVDYSSFDNYGSYVDQIKSKILIKINFHFFVHSKYKYECSNTTKLFNKISHQIKNKWLKKVVVFFEMVIDFFYIFLKLLVDLRYEKTIIVSLYQPFITYKFLFYLVKLSKTKLCIIVHDLIPLDSSYPKLILSKQENLLKMADMYIVHNDHSRRSLIKSTKKVHIFRFPILEISPSRNKEKTNKNINILFIGNIRKEKGVEILLAAWILFCKNNKNTYLTIAGSLGDGLHFNFSNLENFTHINGYLDDQMYANLIQQCNYGILPYTGGTNSGVLSTFVSLNKPVITSDILLFKDSNFALDPLTFESGNINSLVNVLENLMINPDVKLHEFEEIIKNRVLSHKSKFIKELNYAISSIAFDSN
jgi:glycosyltransferase involved in cell wall biosynthesis